MPGQLEHVPGEREGDLHQVLRALAAQRLDRLLDLEGVADGAAERGVHPGDERPGADAVLLAEGDHGAGEVQGPVPLLP